MTGRWPLKEMALAVEGVMAEHGSDRGAFDSIGIGADGTETLRIDQLAERTILDIVETVPGGLNVLSEEISPSNFPSIRTVSRKQSFPENSDP